MANTLSKAAFISLLILCMACGSIHKSKNTSQSRHKTLAQKDSFDEDNDSLIEAETDTFYLVEVASGYNYDSLRTICNRAADELHYKVDQMDRIYRPGKGIVLPDTCDDDIYCGEYYPRRPFGDQNFLSIEMQYAYEPPKEWKERDTSRMIILANIFPFKPQADSVVEILKPHFNSAHTLQAALYLGCMH